MSARSASRHIRWSCLSLLARIALLRAELRLPAALIQWYLVALHGLELSVGCIVSALQRVAGAGATSVATLLAAIRGSPYSARIETHSRSKHPDTWDGSSAAKAFQDNSKIALDRL